MSIVIIFRGWEYSAENTICRFIFQDRVFESFEEFQTAIIIDNKNILQLEKPLEILRAGIIDNEPMLKTPWGDKRLADKAVNK